MLSIVLKGEKANSQFSPGIAPTNKRESVLARGCLYGWLSPMSLEVFYHFENKINDYDVSRRKNTYHFQTDPQVADLRLFSSDLGSGPRTTSRLDVAEALK